ncbi:hypothetical protein DFP72DRAFT_914719 [Ephemerocybe angulata]|uniref:SnoaL-like domain-containing protein n=1 Tax=Ephemerocybe angulata TaxID=980116 RepID=A0A8H6M0U5_9AGAR|nr:hypothetical protein DFP72DRAFT_914719 [Tulosesus angulatus]
MRFIKIYFAAVLLCATSALAKPPSKPKVCSTKEKGPDLEEKQQEALAGFAHLFLDKQDVKAAFDTYVPGEYIQHNPFSAQGREVAIEFLAASMAAGVKTSNLTIFGGQGYGSLHYKMVILTTNETYSVLDYFRFKGTCIVEHWDVLQTITGNETNPIAYF